MKRARKSDPVARILAAARKDPQFFHELVFAPKKAIAKAKFLDRATKTRLLNLRAGSVISDLLFADCGSANTCSGATCNHTCTESCQTQTCGGGSCQDTCAPSCPDTITPPHPGRLVARLDSIRWKLTASQLKQLRTSLGR
jgi:hypothetical protein